MHCVNKKAFHSKASRQLANKFMVLQMNKFEQVFLGGGWGGLMLLGGK